MTKRKIKPNPERVQRPVCEMAKERPELQHVASTMRKALEAQPIGPTGRRPYGGVHALYPRAETVVDVGLVGRAELIELAGLDGQEGRKWYASWIAGGKFPPADGQVIDRRPTWQRTTIVPFMYLAARQDGQRVLAPKYWPEAEALLDAQEATAR